MEILKCNSHRLLKNGGGGSGGGDSAEQLGVGTTDRPGGGSGKY